MKIKNVEIKNKAVLAPMAGVADRAFRELCVSFGASYCVCEMVSSKGVSMNDKKSKELMYISPDEHPAAIQIFGNSPEIMAIAAKQALEFSPDIIDINMGCPAPKISKGGSGASLMRDPVLAGEIISAVNRVSCVPVSVKIRKGWDENSVNAVEMALIAEKNGASAVTVHGRTKEQMYAPPVDFNIIKQVKQALKIPVIGNGDIFKAEDAVKMLESTGCDLVMVGRGALGNPWIFSQSNALINENKKLSEPLLEEKMKVMLSHIETICFYRGSRNGINEARKHAVWYTKGIAGAAQYRNRLSNIKSLDELKQIANEILEIN